MIRSSIARRSSGANPEPKVPRSRSAELLGMGINATNDSHDCGRKIDTTGNDDNNKDYHDNVDVAMNRPSPSSLDRATSDIYDAQEIDDDDDGILDNAHTEDETAFPTTQQKQLLDNNMYSSRGIIQALPTFARYPVVASKNKNCWNEPPVSLFHVRGRNYFVDKKKIASGPYLFQARGIDLFLADDTNKIDLSVLYVLLRN